MKLEDWMAQAGITDTQLATKVGRDRSVIAKLRAGKTMPSLQVLAAFERLSEGQVTARDFLPSSAGFAEDPAPPIAAGPQTRLIISGLDPATMNRLRLKAELAGRTIEDVARDLLAAGAQFTPQERLAVVDRIRAMSPKLHDVDVVAMIREDRDRR